MARKKFLELGKLRHVRARFPRCEAPKHRSGAATVAEHCPITVPMVTGMFELGSAAHVMFPMGRGLHDRPTMFTICSCGGFSARVFQ